MKEKAIVIFIFVFLAGISVLGQHTKRTSGASSHTTGKSSVSFPDTAEGQRGKAFMDLLNSDDDSVVQRFVKDQMSADKTNTQEERVKRFIRTRALIGGAKLRKITNVSKTKLSYIIERSSGTFAKVRMEFDPHSGGRIRQIGIEPVSKDELEKSSDTRSLTESELGPAVEKFMRSLAKKDEFSGTVLIAKNGKPIFSKAVGFANRERKLVNKTDTKFNLGSINKLFTIISIGILADEGKLKISDFVGKHLPKYPNPDVRKKVTIEHLLTMSSGIGDIFGEEYSATPKTKLRTTNDYLPLFASKPLAFEPGSKRKYSNGGFLVLGAIIEKASGQTYYDFVRERIYKPIGMSDTESYESDSVIPNMAEGYMYSKTAKRLVNNVTFRPARGSSGGGGYSTAPDLLKFANAIESGEFPMPKSLKQMSDRLINGLANGILRFGGGAPGINAMIVNKVSNKYTVIVLSNLSSPSASNVSRQIRAWLNP